MSAYRDRSKPSEPRRWIGLWLSLTACTSVWVFSTPLFTGPDEVSQARRAAAVVTGELTGRQDRPGPPLLLTVEVPALYGEPAEQSFLCHLGPLLDGAPQDAMPLPSPPCPDLDAARDEGGTVEAETVQYRGQPFFYALVGIPTLVDEGTAGAYGMRLLGAMATASLLASALLTASASRRPPLAVLALLACTTPGLLYLGGSTNPSAVEIAAALSAWAAAAMLVTTRPDQVDDPLTGRLVRRLGTALVVLAACRGLGPAFAAAVVVVGGLAAGPSRVRSLLRRRDLRWWGSAVLVATAASGAWLAHIGSEHPLPERAGSGFGRALGWLPWYLRQSVGVFGTNDSGVTPFAAVTWWAVAAMVTAAGAWFLLGEGRRPRPVVALRGHDRGSGIDPVGARTAVLGVLTLVGGLLVNVTAEGLSLPPIGFFWQGRYALPLALGGIVLVSTGRPPRPEVCEQRPAVVVAAAAAVLVAIHGHAMWVVAVHHGLGGADRLVATVAYALALVAAGALGLGVGGRARRDLGP